MKFFHLRPHQWIESIINKNLYAPKPRNPLVRIGIPAGLTPQPWQLQELLDRKTVEKVEHTKQEIILYVNTLDQDESKTIALDLVAAIPGTYSSIPSRAYPYYDQSSTVWNKGHTVEITP